MKKAVKSESNTGRNMSLKSLWKYNLKGARSVTQRAPIIVGNTVFAVFNHRKGSFFQGTLSAIDLNTGEEIWRFETEHILNEPCISDDNCIYITCFDGTVYKLSTEGNLEWKSQPSQCNLWAGILLKDRFYYAEIGGRSKHTRSLNTNDGSVVWEYENGGHSYALATDHNQCVVHGSVSGSVRDKTIYLHCLQKETGETLWQTQHPQYLFQPLIIGNFIYIGSRSHVALFSLHSGELLATHHIEDGVAVTAKPIKVDDTVVFITEKGRFFCLSTIETTNAPLPKKSFDLKQLWSVELSNEVKAKVFQDGSQLIAITEAGSLVAIDSANGEILYEEKLSGFKGGYGITKYENDFIISVSKDCARITRKTNMKLKN